MEDTLYAVSAQLERQTGQWISTLPLPTFYLDSRVQGIRSHEHADRIARDILGHRGDHVTVHICVQAVGR